MFFVRDLFEINPDEQRIQRKRKQIVTDLIKRHVIGEFIGNRFT